jgi:hypothetical protein
LPSHGNDGNIDIREDIGGRAQNYHWRQDQNQQRNHNKCVRAIESKLDNPHIG